MEYALVNLEDSEMNVLNLTANEVVRAIYREDGGDYELRPKMIKGRYDDDDNELPDTQETVENVDSVDCTDFVYSVFVKKNINGKFCDSYDVAVGKNIEEAEQDFLHAQFKIANSLSKSFMVMTMEEYLHHQELEKESLEN